MPKAIANIIGSGYVAVSLFFVLSGFILAYNYAPDIGQPSLDRRRFWIARFARIYPVYLFAIVLELPRFIQVSMQQPWTFEARLRDGTRVVGASILMIQAWIPSLAYRLNWPSWSVSAEAFFYMTFPLVILVANRRSVRAHPIAACIGIWLGALALVGGVAHFAAGPSATRWLTRETWSAAIVYTPLLRLPEFAIGVVLGVAYNPERESRITDAMARALVIGSLGTLTWLLVVAPSLPGVLLRTGLLAPLFGVLVVGLAFSCGPIARVLGRPSLLLLGEASYAMYILHVPLHAWLRGLDALAGGHVFTSWLWLPLYLVVVVAVSIYVLRTVEAPARARIRKWLTSQDHSAPSLVESSVSEAMA